MKRIALYICFFFSSLHSLFAQELLKGRIFEKDAAGKLQPLGMVGVKWIVSGKSTSTDLDGKFSIPYPSILPDKLIFSMVGYMNDTISITADKNEEIKITLRSAASTLNEVNITEKQQSIANLRSTIINMEKISSKELTNAACCNLSESFERNASVDVSFTDAVSGTKQIQMLGLDGIYTQILYENLPFVRGLASSHGLTYIPGPWVESIYVSKGTGSVVNGHESITGQIQIEMLEPNQADRFFVNGYVNTEQRLELNAHKAHQFSEGLSTILFTHASRNLSAMDKNNDSFLDTPFNELYTAFNRWHYRIGNKAEGQFGVRGMWEDKKAGQNNFTLPDSTSLYSIRIKTQQIETFTKNGFLFPDKPWKSMALMTTERYHRQESLFGNKIYTGEQKSLYLNGISEGIIGTTFHKIKMGGGAFIDYYSESFSNNLALIPDSVFNPDDIVPGAFAEYTYSNDTNLSIVAGLRGDYPDQTSILVTPRVHVKYNPTEETVLRLSGGRGFRTPHLFVENSSILASSRKIILDETIKREIAWNYGMTFTYCFKIKEREGSINFDFFRTDFENQIVADLENPDEVWFYNLKGISYSNSFQTDLNFSPVERLDVKLAYKYYDVKTSYESAGQVLTKPLVPQDRALTSIDYSTDKEKWKFNFTAKWFGSSRLPNTSSNPLEFQRPEQSDPYFTFLGQITKRFRWIEVYLGGENLLNYRIPNPIIDPQNPFGNNFDATMIWGPVNGRVIYGGFRYRII